MPRVKKSDMSSLFRQKIEDGGSKLFKNKIGILFS